MQFWSENFHHKKYFFQSMNTLVSKCNEGIWLWNCMVHRRHQAQVTVQIVLMNLVTNGNLTISKRNNNRYIYSYNIDIIECDCIAIDILCWLLLSDCVALQRL